MASIDTSRFRQDDNPASLKAVAPTEAGREASAVSGGTAAVLPAERAKATFEVEKMTNILDGGVEQTARRRFIISPTEGKDVSDKVYWERPLLLAEHVRHFMGAHEDFLGKIIPTRADAAFMSDNSMLTGSFINHYGLFLPTIVGQASGEQQTWWLPRTLMCQMIGVYAQTELGHGSNVRGLRTTATYDRATEQFVMHTPSLQAVKWWISGLAKVATHALVYAQLIIDDKEYGVHIFLVQLRDENHRPVPGITMGDVGPKLGDNANDTGFLRLDHVRIPRQHMLARWQKVTADGRYVKSEKKTNPRVHYATMVFTRGGMIKGSGGWLARAVTIAARYSCVRHQGFLDTKNTPTYKAPERAVVDYQMQLYRILKQLALTYAIKFTGNWMLETFKEIENLEELDSLPQIASTAAGLKGLTTFLAANGMEDLRKCCGGHGYLLSSGIAAHTADYVWQTTAEGDYVVMMLQCARFLVKALDAAKATGKCPGPTAYLAPLHDPAFSLAAAAPPLASSAEQFADPRYLLQLHHYLALSAVMDAHEEFSSHSKSLPFDEAWNSSAVSLCKAVQAHCLAFMMQKFVEEAEKVEDVACRGVVLELACMYGLSNMMDCNWNGLLCHDQLKLAKVALDRVMLAIRPNLVPLVDAFDIPDRVLQSALGKYDGNVYEKLFEEALKSPLNQSDPFMGYKEHLERFLDLDFLKQPNTLTPDARL